MRGRNRKNVFLVRDQEQERTLCSTQVCVVYIYDRDLLHVHSDACVILSHTAKSKIGRVRSGQAVVLSSPTESNQEGRRKLKQKKGKKGKSKEKPSAAKVLL